MGIGIFISVQHCVGAVLIVLVACFGVEGQPPGGLLGLRRGADHRWERRPGDAGPGEQPGVSPQEEPSGAGKRRFRSWGEVAIDLGRLLRESRFEAYLAEGEPPERDEGGGER